MRIYSPTILYLITLLLPITLQAQQPPATPAEQRLQGYTQRKVLLSESLVSQIPFRSVGPTVFSGRVVDVAVHPQDPSIFYVAYASGGLWKTENNGSSFEPIFDKEAVMTIGDIAVDWQNNIIWVGTGENNSIRSSYSGVGIYKSIDDGKTWAHFGLEESHHIGRIVLHPDNKDIAWVAALGHLYSPNKERGIYKTTDGGKSWKQVLYIDDNTGGIDLIVDPTQTDILYAAMWHRQRRAWNFVEAGSSSGIYKSIDGGNTWQAIHKGFPLGEGCGRIGLALHTNNETKTLYAVVDNQNRRPKEDKEDSDALQKDDLREMTKADFLQLPKEKISQFLSDNRFPEKYDADKVLYLVKTNKIKPRALVEYLEDANSLLFDTPVIGAEVYRSDDEGSTWYKTHEDFLDNVYFSYGYYFGQIRVDPSDADKIYILGVPILKSSDGGKTFEDINGDNVHIDHHALWVNPNRKGHLIDGNDGGINISYDDGITWIKCNSPAVGQFYSVNVDMETPYNIYGGLQDNGVWVGSSNYKASSRWHSTGHYPYKSIMGGDGMQVAIDPRNKNIVYTGFQFGNYYRLNLESQENKYITPKHELGERPLRWNWQSPIHLSTHQADILYIGANKVFRSFDKGNTFSPISEDLTTSGKKGDVSYGTLTCVKESPLQFGLIYTGSDDGLVHLTRNGGMSWKKITDSLPPDLWVSRVVPSSHMIARVYLALNGYRWDDFTAYLYRSDDYGDTWERIGKSLPAEPINVVKEDPENPNLLYIGTDHGVYISLDRGLSFHMMDGGLPNVPVHDLVIHPRDKDLILGTHGRSFYVAEVEHLQQLNDELLDKELHLFALDKLKWSSRWGNGRRFFAKPQSPEISIPFFTPSDGEIHISIKTKNGLVLKKITKSVKKGLQYFAYDGSIETSKVKAYEKWLSKQPNEDKEAKNKIFKEAKNGLHYLMPENYVVVLTKGGVTVDGELVVE